MRVPDAKADIYIIGLGIGGFEQRTVEVDQLLRDAEVVVHLTAFHNELVEICSGQVINLSDLYFSNKSPDIVYQDIAEYIISISNNLSSLGNLCFLNYGHPAFLVDSTWIITENSKKNVKVIPAMSFLDRIFCDIPIRVDNGFSYFEAETLVNINPSFDINYPLIISQVGEIGAEKIEPTTNSHNILKIIRDKLQEQYHIHNPKCHLVFSPYRKDMEPSVFSAYLSELDSLAKYLHNGCSILVEGKVYGNTI